MALIEVPVISVTAAVWFPVALAMGIAQELEGVVARGGRENARCPLDV